MNKIRIEQSGDSMLIIDSKRIKIQRYNEIVSLQYDKPYVRIKTSIKGNNLLYSNLSELKKFLPEYFIQINKATIVNLKFVESIEIIKNQCIAKVEDFEYIISRRREKIVFEYFKRNFPS